MSGEYRCQMTHTHASTHARTYTHAHTHTRTHTHTFHFLTKVILTQPNTLMIGAEIRISLCICQNLIWINTHCSSITEIFTFFDA